MLLPLSGIFASIVYLRRLLYRNHYFSVQKSPVPVIVVGNITVGGSGKTPCVIWMAKYLQEQGYAPGIVSRGYRGKSTHWPLAVRADTAPELAGDEPVLLAQRTGCPVYVAPNRPLAIAELLKHHPCDVIISDDGLQHYAMTRDIEIAILDAEFGLGNGWMLPAGPLREGAARLNSVDFSLTNGGTSNSTEGHTMQLTQPMIAPLQAMQTQVDLPRWRGRSVQAVAGIGRPKRFFDLLQQHDIIVEKHPMPDHHDYQATDFAFRDDRPLLMTEKDAVKCRALDLPNAWVVQVQAEPEPAFIQHFEQLLHSKATRSR